MKVPLEPRESASKLSESLVITPVELTGRSLSGLGFSSKLEGHGVGGPAARDFSCGREGEAVL